ncbi:potassium channel family protein [Agreia sp. COWG]|uniref:potassium channel family protein n=1 Tax=Agreia sp. COWG TaxID=2773266 RepID=UPI001926A2ED|nr:potassium channel family protein [Agreia sp. COWG]CAD6001965.1 putative Potassium voltage-gated channel subfamily KQT; potassium channel, VIC family [Agreia sp. COWG]
MNLARWQKITEWPLTVSAILFLIAYAWEIIAQLTGPAETLAEVVIQATWLLFVVDYVVSLVLAENRARWFVRHLFDLLVVVLPLLRPLRLLRLLTFLSVLNRSMGNAVRGKVVVYVIGAASLVVFVAALAALDAERNSPGATITTFGDALWWAVVTITTVGYGDLSPVTIEGRMIAVALMIGGIGLLGVVTATLASWIVERVARKDEDQQAATRLELRTLTEEIAQLRRDLHSDGGRETQSQSR